MEIFQVDVMSQMNKFLGVLNQIIINVPNKNLLALN
jgi:hypothetical protein